MGSVGDNKKSERETTGKLRSGGMRKRRSGVTWGEEEAVAPDGKDGKLVGKKKDRMPDKTEEFCAQKLGRVVVLGFRRRSDEMVGRLVS